RRGIDTATGGSFAAGGRTSGGGLATVSGAIRLVETQVSGDIETVNGDVTVGIGSVVGGGITISRASGWFQSTPRRKPRVVIGPRAVVHGPLEFEREVRLYVHRSARTGKITGAEPVVFDTDTAPQD